MGMSKTCAFLRNATIWNTREVMEKIKLTAIDLITNKGVDIFLVGTKGNFETLSHKMMEQIQRDYPDIKIMLVIAYAQDLERCPYNFDDIYYPTKAELANKRWSISRRNEWIIEQTDYIIACNQYRGRAYNYCEKAKRKGKEIIEIGK